jgi:hypothetical protein
MSDNEYESKVNKLIEEKNKILLENEKNLSKIFN